MSYQANSAISSLDFATRPALYPHDGVHYAATIKLTLFWHDALARRDMKSHEQAMKPLNNSLSVSALSAG